MRSLLVTSFAAFAALAGWTNPAAAGLLSSTGPVIAILAGDLYLGEAEGNLDGSGTIVIKSQARAGVGCRGEFTSGAEHGGTGDLRCSDGATATLQFKRLSLVRGYGSGSSSRGALSFTYGLSAEESAPYLTLPPGKVLARNIGELKLVDASQPLPARLASTGSSAPDAMLSAATLVVTDHLRRDNQLHTGSAVKIAELVESTLLPLFDFRHMTRLAVARNWPLASPGQQDSLSAEFKTLLVRTYSSALARYRDQVIEYMPLRMASGATDVTVKSTVSQPGSARITIDYDMEMTTAGWRVYDIKLGGISLVTTYRSSFAQTVRDLGLDGLIKTLATRNLQVDAGPGPYGGGGQAAVIMYAVIPSVFRGDR
ncbi:MAG: ABC transporter substrate-binding protein [Burkholderiales bacterium]